MSSTATIPASFATMIAEREGDAGRRWLERLPERVRELCRRWRLEIDGAAAHGYVGVVIPVRRAVEPLALKVTYPYEEARLESVKLAAWGGDGAARVADSDLDRWAVLMERLEGSHSLADEPVDEALEVIGGLWPRLHAPPVPPGFPSTNDLAHEWRERIPYDHATYAQGVPDRLVQAAVEMCAELQSATTRLLHGDLHFENVLAGHREDWLAIDPKAEVGDPDYEAFIAVWNRMDELPADRAGGLRNRLQLVCDTGDLDVSCAARWSVVRAVENAVSQRSECPSGPGTDVELAEALLPLC